MLSDEELEIIRADETIAKGQRSLAATTLDYNYPNLADKYNPAARSRPHLGKWPIPWLAGIGPKIGSWAHISRERVAQAEENRLCIMCGTPLTNDYVYANVNDQINDRSGTQFEILFKGAAPTPTFTHPRCLLLAASFCPHLKAQEHPGLDKTGKLITRDDLRKMTSVHHE